MCRSPVVTRGREFDRSLPTSIPSTCYILLAPPKPSALPCCPNQVLGFGGRVWNRSDRGSISMSMTCPSRRSRLFYSIVTASYVSSALCKDGMSLRSYSYVVSTRPAGLTTPYSFGCARPVTTESTWAAVFLSRHILTHCIQDQAGLRNLARRGAVVQNSWACTMRDRQKYVPVSSLLTSFTNILIWVRP